MNLVDFLHTVPLFNTQLPHADLPKVAGYLQRTVWEAGARVVEQGSMGEGFFLVLNGKASVVAMDDDCDEQVRATLRRGDYWGEKSLTQACELDFSVVAHESMPLETLSITRAAFEELGLTKKLKFPRRPAMYQGQFMNKMLTVKSGSPASKQDTRNREKLTEEELRFVKARLLECDHLRALSNLSDDVAQRLAKVAVRRRIPKGELLCKGGEITKELFVIGDGSFSVSPTLFLGTSCCKSAEAAVTAQNNLVSAMARKQQFVLDLDLSMSSISNSCMDVMRTSSMPTQKRSGGDLRSKTGVDEDVKMPSLMRNSRNAARTKTEFKGLGHSSLRLREKASNSSLSEMDVDTPRASRFNVGDQVTHIHGGTGSFCTSELVGRVVEVPTDGDCSREVTVEFPHSQGRHLVPPEKLRLVDHIEELEPYGNLTKGATVGELAMLFNMRLVVSATAIKDSVVFAIGRHDFKECLRPYANCKDKFKKYVRLMDEVRMLEPMLQSERVEVARNIEGHVKFGPGERVLEQGEHLDMPLWYIIEKGSCTMTSEADQNGKKLLISLSRGGHFGERSVVLGQKMSEYSVDAGPEGMTCVTIAGEIMRSIWARVGAADENEESLDAKAYLERQESRQRNNSGCGEKHIAPQLTSLKEAAKLGEGGFGTVFLMEDESTKKEYALKSLRKSFLEEANVTEQVRSERDIMWMLDSDFIVRLLRSYSDSNNVYLLMEAVPGGNLYEMLCEHEEVFCHDAPQGSAAMFYVAGIIEALAYLHERHIVYRDLKLENVLLDAKGYPKLCDMGFARFILGKTHTFLGTPDYMAPEMIDAPHSHGKEVDWWALGVLSYELLCGNSPWKYDNEATSSYTFVAVRECQKTTHPENHMPDCPMAARDFVKRLLTCNVQRRLGSLEDGKEVRAHKWFTSEHFNFEALAKRSLPSPCEPGTSVREDEYHPRYVMRRSAVEDDLRQWASQERLGQ